MKVAILSASDGLVITMLCAMALSLGVIGVLIFCMRRNARRRDRQVDELLEEVAAAEERDRHAASVEDPPGAAPWERDGDWWKS
jgi:hypothetical protein